MSTAQTPAIAAGQLKQYGRGPDTELVHMAPEEVNSLRGLAVHFGGDLTQNPDTGLPEAGFLSAILPTLFGGLLAAIPGVGPLAAAGIIGAGKTAISGDLGQGLLAGLGAFGGASLAGGLGLGAAGSAATGAGTGVATGAADVAATSAATGAGTGAAAGLGQAIPGSVEAAFDAALVPQLAQGAGSAPLISAAQAGQAAQAGLSQGIGSLPNLGAPTGFMDKFAAASREGLKAGSTPYKVAPYVAAAGPVLNMTQPDTPTGPEEEEGPEYRGPYQMKPRALLGFPEQSAAETRDSRERLWFDPANPGVEPRREADTSNLERKYPDYRLPYAEGGQVGAVRPRYSRSSPGGKGRPGMPPPPSAQPASTQLYLPPPQVQSSYRPGGPPQPATLAPRTMSSSATPPPQPATMAPRTMSSSYTPPPGPDLSRVSEDPATEMARINSLRAQGITQDDLDRSRQGNMPQSTTQGLLTSRYTPPSPPTGGAMPQQQGLPTIPGSQFLNRNTPPQAQAPSRPGGKGRPGAPAGGAMPQQQQRLMDLYRPPQAQPASTQLYLPPAGGAMPQQSQLGAMRPSSPGGKGQAQPASTQRDIPPSQMDLIRSQAGGYAEGGQVPPTRARLYLDGGTNAAGQQTGGVPPWVSSYNPGGPPQPATIAPRTMSGSATPPPAPLPGTTPGGKGGTPSRTSPSQNLSRVLGTMMQGAQGHQPGPWAPPDMVRTYTPPAGGAMQQPPMSGPSMPQRPMGEQDYGFGSRLQGLIPSQPAVNTNFQGPFFAAGGQVNMAPGGFVMDARATSELGNGSSSAGQQMLGQMGGMPIQGPGDGVSDSIPATIGGQQPAAVARDEVYFPPEAVAQFGGGDMGQGTQQLYDLMRQAHEARTSVDRGEPNQVSRGIFG